MAIYIPGIEIAEKSEKWEISSKFYFNIFDIFATLLYTLDCFFSPTG